MGIFQPGLLTDFDCTNVISTATVSSDQGFVNITPPITLTVNSPFNHVWLNAYATWQAEAASDVVHLRFMRDDNTPLCTADTAVNQNNQINTTALSCCDTGVSGVHTYTLQASITRPANAQGVKTVTFTHVSLQGAVINT